jgi:NAD(P)-dependent dehydrogenase (short-subunit alcohol dehydrogenase family)
VAATVKHAARALNDGGAIVVVGSLNSWRGDPNITSYVASKHAVLGIVRSAALDLGRRGIRVNAVAPGPIATGALLSRMERRHASGGPSVPDALVQAAAATALGRIATVEDVAEAVLFLAGDGATTGHLLPVDGGL